MDESTPTPSPSAPLSWSLAIHGGAGAISREFDPERLDYMRDLREALDAGEKILRAGGSALDACVAAVKAMEDSPLFNAGIGSVLTADGTHELDAAVMRGSDMAAGAVAGVRNVRNPVELAKEVMEHSPHVLLISSGAEAFALTRGFTPVENSLFTTPARLKVHQQLIAQAAALQSKHAESSVAAVSNTIPTSSPQPPFYLKPVLDHSGEAAMRESSTPAPSASPNPSPDMPCNVHLSPVPPVTEHAAEKKYGTVGAVALDSKGELATAISTGGMSMKAYGRVGDSPVIGAGFYATKNVAVCCTGNGEAFMRCAVAKDVTALVEYKGLDVATAAQQAIENGERLVGTTDFEGGLIAVDSQGRIAMPFNSRGMYRGSVTSNQPVKVAVWRD